MLQSATPVFFIVTARVPGPAEVEAESPAAAPSVAESLPADGQAEQPKAPAASDAVPDDASGSPGDETAAATSSMSTRKATAQPVGKTHMISFNVEVCSALQPRCFPPLRQT